MAETSDFRLSKEDIQRFQESGIAGPFRLLGDHEVKSVVKKLSIAKAKLFLWHRLLSRSVFLTKVLIHARWGKARWQKGLHLVCPVAYALSTTSVILDKIESILGPNLIQWGSDFITQKPGRLHRWHVDAECLECDGITVWLALDNVNDMTAMKVVSGSHRLPMHPVQLSRLYGLNTSDDDAVLNSARELDSRCEVTTLEVKAGEFYIFHGRLWHSTRNRSLRPRSAITFQYSPTSATVKMPAGDYQFPFKWDSRPVPCCLVRGIDDYGLNLLIDPRYPKLRTKSDQKCPG